MEKYQLDQHEGWSFTFGNKAEINHLIVLAGQDEPEEIVKRLTELDLSGFTLAGFRCDDWNDELTPWPSDPLTSGQSGFGGKGNETLDWLCTQFIPEINNRTGRNSNLPVCLGGYSLGGLFALWALHCQANFSSVASCSGSLWYPGWNAFMINHPITPGHNIYLSLGDKEGKAGKPIMRTVAPVTEMVYNQYRNQTNKCQLVWENGGHFQDVEGRIVRAVTWLIENEENNQ